MKNIVLTIALFLGIICVSCNTSGNKSQESVYEKMARYTGSPISNQLPDINRIYEYETKDTLRFSGFCSPVDENKAYQFVKEEKVSFNKKGYLLFVFTDNDYRFFLGAIKSNDEMDIVRWRGTDGINYDHTNEDIIHKLEEWNKTNPIEIDGVSFDWVMFHFENPVTDIESFSNEVYDFCPDIVDQGAGSIEVLRKIIEEENSLFLWWD